MGKVSYPVLALSLVLSASPAWAVDIPVVPASVMKKNVPEPIKTAKTDAARSMQTLPDLSEESVLTMELGVNQIVPIAVGHLNRIVTPFDEPMVTTTSDATTEIRENVVYVATEGEAPVTMFITQKGNESKALSLTMVPRRIPPREIFLKMAGGMLMPGMFSNSKAERWEESQPYVETIRGVFRKMALGEVPQGYTMNKTPKSQALLACSQTGLSFDFANGQILMGHHLMVLVGVATNVSSQPIEFKESLCGNWDVAAVAAWPLIVLEPGQKTEVYVAKKQKRGVAPVSKRPSLLRGAQ